MEIRLRLLTTMLLASMAGSTLAKPTIMNASQSETRALNIYDTGLFRSLRYLYQQCAESEDIYRCSKIQMAKMLGRAYKVPHLNIMDGLVIVKKKHDNDTNAARSTAIDQTSKSQDLENLPLANLDAKLLERFLTFLRSREIEVNLPRLLVVGQQYSEQFLNFLMGFWDDMTGESEARGKKKDDKKYLGPFIAAVMLKAAILKMAYHSIAILAGKALIVGKIALIISAIIGLKKLVSSEGGEKTTYEIVKHPQVQQSHTYSSSHAGEYEAGGHEGGSYHRSIDDEMMMQDKAYNAWVPTTNKIS